MILFIHIGFVKITWIDLIDIFLVTLLLYQLYQMVKGSMASRILLGGASVFVIWLLVSALDLELLGSILGQFINVGVIAALILFQQEIRKFLLVIGKSYTAKSWLGFFLGGEGITSKINVEMILETIQELSISQTGALIVFAKSSELKFFAESGDLIDGIPSKRLILSIFNKYSPLHDGAVIIGQSGRVKAARCILPVSDNDELPASLGLRHRAAIGLTEITDALVVVVSEENGAVSVAKNGRIYKDMNPQELKDKLLLNLSSRKTEEAEEEKVNEDEIINNSNLAEIEDQKE